MKRSPLRRLTPLVSHPREPRKRPQRVAGRRNPIAPSATTRQVVYDRENGHCAHCGTLLQAGWHLSHRVARGMGGTRDPLYHSPANVVASCPPCNQVVIEYEPEECEGAGWKVRHGKDPRTEPFLHAQHGWILLDDEGGWVKAWPTTR